MAKTLIGKALFLLAMLAVLPVQAETLRDPTQPPAAFTANLPGGGDPEPVESAAPRVLQSIIKRHGARPVALISGQRIALGQKIDDFVLVKLTDSAATLKGPAGTEILVMSPAVDKKPLRPVRAVR